MTNKALISLPLFSLIRLDLPYIELDMFVTVMCMVFSVIVVVTKLFFRYKNVNEQEKIYSMDDQIF